MLKGFENKDPPRVKNLVVHTDLPDCMCKWGHIKGRSPQQQAVGDWVMIGFYYPSCVGGYTAPKQWDRQPRTQQFLVNDVTFFKLSKTCGFLSPLLINKTRLELLAAVAATLRVTEQNLFFKGACVHHGSLEVQIFACPVKALARQVSHICVHTSYETKFLCEYWNSIGRGNVTDRDISFYMKITAEKLGYPIRNILPDRIDTYSNQAGGACAMKLAGFDDGSIRKMGIWLTYLEITPIYAVECIPINNLTTATIFPFF